MGPRDPVVCIAGAGPAGLATAHLLSDPEFSRWFARSYVGVDE